MIKYLMEKFSLTEKGSKQLIKSAFISFFTDLSTMLPAILLMMFANDVLIKKHVYSKIYIIFSVITIIVIYILLHIEYDNMYNTTYEESANLRIDIANKLLNLPLSYFSKHDLSDLSQTIMSDIDAFEHAFGHSLIKIGGFILLFPTLFILLIFSNITMTFAVIIPSFLSFILIPLARNIGIKNYTEYHNILRKNSEAFQETIEMQQEIKSFSLCEKFTKNLFNKMDQSEKIHLKTETISFLVLTISNLFSYISIAIVTIVGLNLLINGKITIIYLAGFLLFALKLKELLDTASGSFIETYYLAPKIKRLNDIRKQLEQKGIERKIDKFDIEFKDVCFSYEKGNMILNNISFKIPENKVTALVGISGCGKTSILRLISRLYDYNSGKILIGKNEISNISTKCLFDKISIVFQDVILFNTSILENIRIGDINASDEKVVEAAKLANCTEFIENLKDGFDTIIGENGVSLSGGQRQRIAIARAFLKDAPILILDELGANLDVDNEKKIQESLNKLIRNKTVIIISHRLKSIENVDNIIVLDKGKLECQGTHEYVLKNSKVYNDLLEKTNLVDAFKY